MSHTPPRGGLPLYLFSAPGTIGGASTKVAHLIRLLSNVFKITVVPPHVAFCKDKEVRRLIEPFGAGISLLKDLPGRLEGVALAVCERDLFSSGRSLEIKRRGLKLVWSNEMMWAFDGEAEAARNGIIDRVLFVSEFQAAAFAEIYQGVPAFHVGNYIDPDDYAFRQRQNPTFTLGRLSRADPKKYPLDFPVFYEELGLGDVRYRVMAWNRDLEKQYRWHHFGPEWELLSERREPALKFLYSLDVFLYPLGHRVKESWGRAVVEAMLTGCVPVVPAGHQFQNFIVSGETGFICQEFSDFNAAVHELYENYPRRMTLGRRASCFARDTLCSPGDHRKKWVEALTF